MLTIMRIQQESHQFAKTFFARLENRRLSLAMWSLSSTNDNIKMSRFLVTDEVNSCNFVIIVFINLLLMVFVAIVVVYHAHESVNIF